MMVELLNENTMTMFSRIVIAAVLCGFIGLEREVKNHPAGFRTHLLVGVGSCLMMVLSLFGFEDYMKDAQHVQFDPARIPSYVISGIGFLGGGTILVKGATVRGLTTAASIWIVAGLGLVIGAGLYGLACFTTIIVLLSLIFLNRFEKYMSKEKFRKKMKVMIQSKKTSIDEVVKKLSSIDVQVNRIVLSSCRKDREGQAIFYYQLDINVLSNDHQKLERIMVDIQEVEKIF